VSGVTGQHGLVVQSGVASRPTALMFFCIFPIVKKTMSSGSSCVDSQGIIKSTPTCAGFASTLTSAEFDQYNNNRGGVNLTSVINFDPNNIGGELVAFDASRNQTYQLGGFVNNDITNALRNAGWKHDSKPQPPPSPSPCDYTKTKIYMITMIIFIILSILGWILFALKAAQKF